METLNKDLSEMQQKTATKTANIPGDLLRIIESWETLPRHIKEAIEALVACVGR